MSARRVTLDGGSPWGFRMHGGADVQQQLRISRVNPGSKAAQKGIREGDLISAINGQPTRDVTNSEAHALLRNAGEILTLGLNEESCGSPKRRAQKSTQEYKEDISKRISISSSCSTASTLSNSNRTSNPSNGYNEEQTKYNGNSKGQSELSKSQIISSSASYSRNGASCNNRGNNGSTEDVTETTSSQSAGDSGLLAVIMADNVHGSSRSRRQRKSRSNRKKSKKNDGPVHQAEPTETGEHETSANQTVQCEETIENTNVSEFSANKLFETITEEFQVPIKDDIDETQSTTFGEQNKLFETITEEFDNIHPTTPTEASSCTKEKCDQSATSPASQDDKMETKSCDESSVCDNKIFDLITEEFDNMADSAQPKKTLIHMDSKSFEETYRVESPVTVEPPKKSPMIKSRSLDDDEIKITEVADSDRCSSVSESAVVSEAESDIEWETANDIEKQEEPEQYGRLTVITLPLERHETFENSHISPEDEKSLRDFLKGLNLVSSAEESAKNVEKTSETARAKRAKKRAALVQHFLPFYHNPRYLDVISEENSDLSDKEHKQEYKQSDLAHCSQMDYYDEDDDVFEPVDKDLKLRQKYQTSNEAKLVGIKLLDCTKRDTHEKVSLGETSWSMSIAEECSGPEVVYLEDSSCSETPSDVVDQEADDADEEDISTDLDRSWVESTENIDFKSSEGPFNEETHNVEDKPNKEVPKDDLPNKEVSNDDLSNEVSNEDLTSLRLEIHDLITDAIKQAESKLNSDIEDEFNKELKTLCDGLNRDITKDDSPCSSVCSSRSESQCTAVYNPAYSSLTNILAFFKEGSVGGKIQPTALKEICIQKLLSLPFGTEVIEELANVSMSIEEMTGQTSDNDYKHTFPNSPCQTDNDFSSVIAAQPVPGSESWVGMPLERDPKTLVCLSPSQKSFIDTVKHESKEADKLLDLHKKYFERRSYSDEAVQPKKEMPIRGLRVVVGQNEPTYVPYRTKQSTMKLNEIKEHKVHENINYDRYIKLVTQNVPIQIERQTHKPVNNIVVDKEDSTSMNQDEDTCLRTYQKLDLNRRRHSLPYELYEQQMKYIIEKEREIEREIELLNEEKLKLENESDSVPARTFDVANYNISRLGDIATIQADKRPKSMSSATGEMFRQQMYDEYMNKIAERQERKHNKVIKITSTHSTVEESQSSDARHSHDIGDEFITKVRQRMSKLGLEDENEETKVDEDGEAVLVMDGPNVTGVKELPKHLKEFVDLTCTDEANGVWSPNTHSENKSQDTQNEVKSPTASQHKDDPGPVVWTPKSAGSSPTAERKEFKPVNFESPTLGRKNKPKDPSPVTTPEASTVIPPWKQKNGEASESCVLTTSVERRLTSSQSAPVTGLSNLSASKLPRAQNPTITLLQKAREGQLPRGAHYIEAPAYSQPKRKDEKPPIIGPNEILYSVKSQYISESDNEKPKKMADLSSRKFEGIGPTTKDGMPLVLRSEVKDSNQAKWYKRMYETLHRAKADDEYVTVRYKQRRGGYPYASAGGYLSEPEPTAYDSDATMSSSKFATLDRRRTQTKDKENEYVTYTIPRNNKYMSASVKHSTDIYKNQPGRIEDYVPGHSSISEKEAKEWWDEVMEIFDGHLEQQKRVPPPVNSYMSHALKESGYESDSTLVFKRRDDTALQLSPQEQKEAYKTIQKGGEVPLHGLRKLAPERPKDESELEYFPLSPTLTRIRIHKNMKPINQILCYPVTVHHQVPQTFSTFKRTAPSTITQTQGGKPNPEPPNPPRRRSSRNSHTLRLISTMTVQSPTTKSNKRHETCFKSMSESNVKNLRDKLANKLKVTTPKKDYKPTKPCSITSQGKSLLTVSDPKGNRTKSQTNLSPKRDYCNRNLTSVARRCCRNCSFSVPPKRTESTFIKSRATSAERTFGTEKQSKTDLFLPKVQDSKTASCSELRSPTEVKKVVQKQRREYPVGSTIKKSTSLYASAKNGTKSNEDKSLNVTVTFSPQGKDLIQTHSPIPKHRIKSQFSSPSSSRLSSPVSSRKCRTNSPALSTASSIKSRTPSVDSLQAKKRDLFGTKLNTTNRLKSDSSGTDDKKKPKRKKEKNGDDPKKKKTKDAEKLKVKKNNNNDKKKTQTPETVPDNKQSVQTDMFFQHLFLRDLSPTPSTGSKSSYIIERSKIFENAPVPFQEPTLGAIKVYLSNRKPVSESKFKSLDHNMGHSYIRRPSLPIMEDPECSDSTPIRSPSCRRIQSMKDKESMIRRKQPRAKSASEADTIKRESLKRSDTFLSNTDLPYLPAKSNRFKELNQFYLSLERLRELEKCTSTTNLKPRMRNEEEIIDYDRWKQVRTLERAKQEFDALYKKLFQDQIDKDLLFQPKTVETFKWKYDRDRGLRVKERSVENIKEKFERLKEEDEYELYRKRFPYERDIYKPLWRGDSVVNLATKMVERRSSSETRALTTSARMMQSAKLLTKEIGSRLWSSLSMEQVNTLKNQLAEIYSQMPPKQQDYTINVVHESKKPSCLQIRRNSSTDHTQVPLNKQLKSSSIASISSQPLSEHEKKKLSMSLSQEVKSKIYKYPPVVLAKETRGAIAAAEARNKSPIPQKISAPTDATVSKSEPQSVKVESETDEPCKEMMKSKPSSSETESASSDTSIKTAIFLGDGIHKKIEYFEHSKDEEPYIPTVYKPAEDIDEDPSLLEPPKSMVPSQSYADLKELFGENELLKFATLPLSATRKSISIHKPQLRATSISPVRTISNESSCENIYRCRSLSPEEKYWMNYLSYVKSGDVKRLAQKFENIDYSRDVGYRRCKSDSEISNNMRSYELGNVYSLRDKYENAHRGRSRTRKRDNLSPIPKAPLKLDNRFMPHINIISKLASLYPKKSNVQKTLSVEQLAKSIGCPVGEVEKLRERFDGGQKNISLLGHMFTSSPDVHELRDIAPYLAGSWIAHQYPRTQDNTKVVECPRKYRPKPKSVSPIRSKLPSSILKLTQKDFYANQAFDPIIHRPTHRYIPPFEGRHRSWSPNAKHSVKFKEPVMGPTPPPKGHHIFKDYGSESPRKYMEKEVTIHYRSPVRHEIKESVSEEELARRQAEAMRRIYQEERRRKYLQELQDMNSRRHTDNFIPSQKSPIPLNRYDDFVDDLSIKVKPRDYSPEPHSVARALYNFVGQSSKELTFKKGDIIFIRRKIDKNWYEGEHNAMIGLFPSNYVEIASYDNIKPTPRKANEGQARAKFNFKAQTQLELSLIKGELVVLTRRVDDNWFEGRIGNKKGIFPVSYVEILIDPSNKIEGVIPSSKPVASPAAHSLLLNGSSGGKESMGSHHYQPSYNQNMSGGYQMKQVTITPSGSYTSLSKGQKSPAVNEALHIDTHSEPIPYRALYKYRPQNDDELELQEGDTVFVLEKCDDGWYVGSSQRTGAFGTFPGNYVERI